MSAQTARRSVVIRADSLSAKGADLRQALTMVVGNRKRQAEAALSAGGGLDKLRLKQAIEDANEITALISSVIETWDDHGDDVRPRIEMLAPLAPYVRIGGRANGLAR